MQMIASANASAARGMGHSRHPSLAGLPVHNFDHVFGGMSVAMGQRGMQHGLSKLEMGNGADFNSGLRTAPAFGPFNSNEFDFESLLFGRSSTINPNALHYNDSPQSMNVEQQSPFPSTLNDAAPSQPFDDNLDWVSGFEHQMTFQNNENVIDGSSPSAMSTTSQSGISDVMVDGSNHPAPAGTSTMWQPSLMGPPQMTNPFAMDLNGSVFPDLLNGAPVSPQPASQKINDPYFSTPPPSLSSMPSSVTGHHTQNINIPQGFNAGPETPPSTTAGNHGASPVTTISEYTRIAIVNTLAKTQPFGRKQALRTAPNPQDGQPEQFKLPSVSALQRYVTAYLNFFHPHLPFLHVPTLHFDMSKPTVDDEDGGVGGRCCLVLGMSMIGSLYERDYDASSHLFDLSKKMIFLFLEDRRKHEMNRAADARRSTPSGDGSQPSDDGSDTPLWLVQAMLLNVTYGHNVMDKIATDIASMHISALIGLAQAAGLAKQVKLHVPDMQDVQMMDDPNWSRRKERLEDEQWLEWKRMEERKRTLFSIFLLSSLLVTAYNHAPALTNSEIGLDLPCDEEFFAAESSAAFFARGGIKGASHNTPQFRDALAELLHPNDRDQSELALHSTTMAYSSISNPGRLPSSKLQPSSYALLLLIYALHNYIWETRQRHHNKVWTNEETERMHRHIEPALRAWQVAWASNPRHSVERPNPFGLGPLPADSIPLLDLAYVRLFVNLSRAKEKFWERDWVGMAEEIARGSQVMENADNPGSSSSSSGAEDAALDPTPDSVMADSPGPQTASIDFAKFSGPNDNLSSAERFTSRREKHLRKASFFAADSLIMADRLGISFADRPGGELPLQVALCAFDCAQVLCEWVATLQDRVGPYLGILGYDDIDFGQMPAIMMLEEDDIKLLEKVKTILESIETKAKVHLAAANVKDFCFEEEGGFVAKLLRVIGLMMSNAGVWQVYQVIAQCLDSQAVHARMRAQRSVKSASE
jgi:hypothetical protein